LADLDRIVATEEANGWFLDRTHFDAMHPVIVQTVCRATLEARRTAHAMLVADGVRFGNPRERFDAAGGTMTSDVERALHTQRMRIALERAMQGDDCPFWVKPQRGYDGRQSDRNRITLNLETGGLVYMRYAAERFTVGVGPSIRLLAGYTFGHVAVLAGAEFSGGPMLKEDDGSRFVLNYFPVVPVVVRFRDGNWIYTIESGVVSLLQGDNTSLSFGVRAGFGIGLVALRTRFFIPWAGIATFAEHYFHGTRPATEFLRGGLRIGIIYDP